MATLYGVNKTKIDAMKPSDILDAGSTGGKVRTFIDTYVGLGTESAADVIEMGPKLPVGARIVNLAFQQVSCGGTPDVGDYEDTDRYIDEATDNAIETLGLTAVRGLGYEVDMTTAATPDNQIIVTLDAAVTLAGVMTLVVSYVVE
jgi:hypothetical protein